MSKMGLTKAQLKLVTEFKDSNDYKQLQYKYIAVRTSGKRASIKDQLIELAKKFVDKYKDKLPKLAYELLVKKFARRFQDYMEDVARPILAQAKKKEPEKEKKEKPIDDVSAKAFAKITPDNLLFVLVNSIISMAETLEDLSDDFKEFKDTFRSAMIVKEGDLIDRKTKKPKHVGWSWLHSIQSELAQLRGISADKKEEEYITTPSTPSTPQPPNYVPVPYPAPTYLPSPPWTTHPNEKPWWEQPNPTYPTITCKNADTDPPTKQ